MLDSIPNTNTDCRKYRKDYGSDQDNARDWHDWLYQHETEYKFQNIIRKKYLYNYYAVQVRDLAAALRKDFLFSQRNLPQSIHNMIQIFHIFLAYFNQRFLRIRYAETITVMFKC